MSETTRALVSANTGLPSASEFELMQRMSTMFAQSGLYKNVTNVAQAIAIVQTGRELGIGPSMALREIFIIEGKPTMSAALLAALVQRDHGDQALQVTETTNDRCVVAYKRRGWAVPSTLEFTIGDAETAQLTRKGGNWAKYPRAMLRSRAIAEACRTAFQDSIMGLYSVEEMAPDAVAFGDDGSMVIDVEAGRTLNVATGELVDAPQVVASAPPASPAPAPEPADAPQTPAEVAAAQVEAASEKGDVEALEALRERIGKSKKLSDEERVALLGMVNHSLADLVAVPS